MEIFKPIDKYIYEIRNEHHCFSLFIDYIGTHEFLAMRFDRNQWSWKLKQKVKWKRNNDNSQKYQITLSSIRTVVMIRTHTVHSHMRLHMNAFLFPLSIVNESFFLSFFFFFPFLSFFLRFSINGHLSYWIIYLLFCWKHFNDLSAT